VEALQDCQGMKRGHWYTVAGVGERRFAFGNFVDYALIEVGTKAPVIDVANGHLLLKKWKPVVTAENASEHKLHEFQTEASDLGIRASDPIPMKIETTLGNKRPFFIVHGGSDRWLYRQGEGCLSLIVWND
jgi:hypothetical protein